ncbi:MAG: hypothetical protein V4582_23325 [Pseudomonadota bacterium]
MTQETAFDASIPVLTEVFADKAAAPETLGAQTAPADLAEQMQAHAVDGWSEQEWEVLERRLCERILRQMQGRIDFVLEQRIKDSLADVLQHALTGLTGEIRSGLQDTLEKIVARAVSQELTHLKTHKKATPSG